MVEGNGGRAVRTGALVKGLRARLAKGLVAGFLLGLALPAAAQGVPASPSGLTADPSDGQVVLRWRTPPAAPSIVRYEVRYRVGAGEFGPWERHATPTATSLTVGGLANFTEHTFQLRAVSAAGAGPWAEIVATPGGLPNFDPEFLVSSGPALVFRVGSPVKTSLPAAFAATRYAVTPQLPNGLSFNPINREISGTPTAAQPQRPYTLTAFGNDEQDTLRFTIEVQPDAMPAFADGVADQLYRVGTPVDTRLPMALDGDGALVYDLAPTLPSGLRLDASNHRIVGTPTRVVARATYTWQATDEDGDQAAVTFAIEVEPDSMPRFRAAPADQRFRVGSAVNVRLPAASGGDGDVVYALTPALPAGLRLNVGSRAIVGTPTAAMATTRYAWTATDEDGDQAAVAFAIEVEPDSMPRFRAALADQRFRVGSAVNVRLPAASGGDGDVVYALRPALPAGLRLNVGRRVIVGTPTAAMATTRYAWTATDEDGDTATVNFSIEVEPDLMPAFTASVADQHYNKSAAILPLVLPNASGGDGALTYGLSPALPPGLAFDYGSGTIAGTPSAEFPRTQYTWIATDEDGDTASLTFAIEVGMAVTVAIADASAAEGTALSFAVTLSGALAVPVTVAYRTVDDTARAGEDYAAASGTLTFAPGTTRLSIDVAVSSDQLAEHDETFAVVLAELVNAEFEDDRATGTIVDDDMERARGEALSQALGVFGTAFAADAVDAVSGRFQEGPPTAPAAPASARSSGLGLAATVAGFFAGGNERPAGRASALGAQLATSAAFGLRGHEHDAWLDDSPGGRPLSGASFQMPFGGGDHADRGQWTLWGRGSTSRVSSETGFAVDGRVDSAYLGVDARMPRNTLLGMAVARSSGEFDYRQAGVSEGELEMEMTAFLPYVHWTLCDGLDLWSMAGVGNGDATLTDNLGAATTDTSLRLAAAGLRHELTPSETFAWALKADALAARLRADEVIDAIAAADADVHRLRLLLEGRRDWPGEQSRVGASFEVGARFDGGDVNSGLGAEVGAALDYRNLPIGLGLEARGRYLVGHAESAFDEWGLSAALELDPGAQGSGASLRLAPAWGAPSSGVADLWRADRMVGETAQARRGFGGRLPLRLDMEVGYGFASKRAGPVRVFGVLGGSSQPSYRLGARSAAGTGFGWRIEVDRVRRFGGQTDHGILFSIGNAPASLVANMTQSFHDEAARW